MPEAHVWSALIVQGPFVAVITLAGIYITKVFLTHMEKAQIAYLASIEAITKEVNQNTIAISNLAVAVGRLGERYRMES